MTELKHHLGAGRPGIPVHDDHLLRALLPQHNVRVVAAVTGDVAREAARRHGAVGGVAAALGRAATAGLLLATITKDRERLTAELAGDGPLGSLMVDAAADGAVRVYVKNPAVPIPALPDAHVPAVPGHRQRGPRARWPGIWGCGRSSPVRHRWWTARWTPTSSTTWSPASRFPACSPARRSLAPTWIPPPAAASCCRPCRAATPCPCWTRCGSRLRHGALGRALAAIGPSGSAEALARAVLGAEAHDLLSLDTRPAAFPLRLLEGTCSQRAGAAGRRPAAADGRRGRRRRGHLRLLPRPPPFHPGGARPDPGRHPRGATELEADFPHPYPLPAAQGEGEQSARSAVSRPESSPT